MKLIINADDYGYTWGVSEGIIYGHRNGIITSTTVLTNCDINDKLINEALACPELGLGVHLTLTLGKSITKNKTLSDADGIFYSRKEISFESLDLKEVEDELRAQIEQFITLFHKLPDHLDSHHSIHDQPLILPITQKLMAEYQLPCRRLSSATYVGEFYEKTANTADFISILAKYKDHDCIEIMTHPAFCDSDLCKLSSYNTPRLKELNVLTNIDIINYIKENNIELVNYGSL